MPRTTLSINVGAEVIGLSRADAVHVASRVEQYLLDCAFDADFTVEILNHDYNVEEATEDA